MALLGRGYCRKLIKYLWWSTAITILTTGGVLWKKLAEHDDYQSFGSTSIHDLPATYVPQSHCSSFTPDPCQIEYDRVHQNRTQGLTKDDLEQSRALIGNRYRLSIVAETLTQRERPVTAVVCGGSISLGHGTADSTVMRYSNRLEEWLNNNYPLSMSLSRGNHTPTNGRTRHQVLNHGSHGADICAMAKRVNILLDDLKSESPDLFILEFAVNDYQGQDFKKHLIHQTDVFFDGFQNLALCAEVAVHKLLTAHPKAAVVFLEFQTAIAPRKTAALLHMGVAKHYQVPVISYAETMFPDFYRLKHLLRQYDYSTVTIAGASSGQSADLVLPYPHGCVPCILDNIVDVFREGGCKSLCVFADRSGEKGLKCDKPPPGREPCYVSFLSHDAVHPSAVGHRIAADLIAEAISTTARDICNGRTYPEHILPTIGFMVANQNTLQQHSDFVMVKDTMPIFSKQDELRSKNHSKGFHLHGDFIDRPGWVATNPQGGEYVEFLIVLPKRPCYAVYLAVLKSYEKMGTLKVTVQDLETKQETTTAIDGLWESPISVPSDVQITADEHGSDTPAGCTGKCKVVVFTDPEISGRAGNKVKIITLSARPCL